MVRSFPNHYFILIYLLLSLEFQKSSNSFWESGDSKAEWLEITEDDSVIVFSQNRDPLPEGGVLKRPKLLKSRAGL